jgi:hypothetical protein
MDPEEQDSLMADFARRVQEVRHLASQTQDLIAESRRIQEKFEETDAELLSEFKKSKSRKVPPPTQDGLEKGNPN